VERKRKTGDMANAGKNGGKGSRGIMKEGKDDRKRKGRGRRKGGCED
jgi:hypothetical protein